MFLKLLPKLLVLTGFITICNSVHAQSEFILRKWYVEDKTAQIEIYKAADNTYFGKVVWLKKPLINGKPKIDIHNPDTSKRKQTLLGMVVMWGFKKTGEGVYEDGSIYDPKNGKVYSCKMSLTGEKLHVRGYWGFSMLGKSTTWTKAE